jgi:hypothetical protein
MRTLVLTAALRGIVAGAAAQTRALPADINPESHSRLPLVKRDQMDENGMRIHDLNEYLWRQGVLGSRLAEHSFRTGTAELAKLTGDQ